MEEVTLILLAMERGEPQAAGRLLTLVYGELRRLAAQKLARENPGQTLDATALVHEAYVRLFDANGAEQHWDSRRHFFAAAAEAMRRILIDNARRKLAVKHGGDRQKEMLVDIASAIPDIELVELDEALEKLTSQDPIKGRLVELRYFAGLTGEQAAKVLGISASTADRHWAYAKAWLQTEIRGK
jgi:RNA polymerase sigma factor (TIGR02999 family)